MKSNTEKKQQDLDKWFEELESPSKKSVYEEMKAEAYKFLDSLYSDFASKAQRRFELGETNYLEMITARSKQRQISTNFKQALQDVNFSQEHLNKLVQLDTIKLTTGGTTLPLQELHTIQLNDNLGLVHMGSILDYKKSRAKLEQQNSLPDLTAEYFQGTNSGLNENLVGYQIGIKIPLIFGGQRAKIKAAKLDYDVFSEEMKDYEVQLQAKYKGLIKQLQKYQEAIDYYNSQGELLSREIVKTASRTYKEGEIDFFQYIQSIETSMQIRLDYLDNLNRYNQTVIELNFIIL